LTALSAELEGRHYGGGVLELVPSEIERLLVPLCKIRKISSRRWTTRFAMGQTPETLLAIQIP